MTIGGWIVFALIGGCLILGAVFGAVGCENIAARITIPILCIIATIGLLIGMLWYYGNTASGKRAMVDQQSDFGNGLNRIVRVYTANGDIIAEFEGKIDIEGNDGGYVLFDYQGKRYTYYNCFTDRPNDYKWTGRIEFGNPNGGYTWGYQIVHLSGPKPNIDTLCWFDMEEGGAYSEVIGTVFDEVTP